MTEYSTTYAQNREDSILSGFFYSDKKGFYVDVGASDPDEFSVTKLFYQKGWRGINIEPIPRIYRRLKAARPGDINLNIGVSDKKGTLTLREYPHADGLSTFSPTVQKMYVHDSRSPEKYIDQEVSVLPLKDIFKEYANQPIDFMKIDVEGFEYEVIAGNDWDTYRPKVLCIEANHILKDWRPIIKRHDYELVFFDGLNEYYVAKERQSIAKRFSYTQAILSKPPVPAELYMKLEANEKELKSTKFDNSHLAAHINRLHLEMAKDSRVRSLTKSLAVALDAAVVANLQRLNKRPIPVPAMVIANSMSKAEVLNEIRTYDMNRYYPPPQTAVYKVVYFVYRSIVSFVSKVLRSAAHMLNGEKKNV